MAMTDDEKRAYSRGYGRGAKWPLHRPPLPPDALSAKVLKAAMHLRDAADTHAATLGDDGDEILDDLTEAIDAFDRTMTGIGRWLKYGDVESDTEGQP